HAKQIANDFNISHAASQVHMAGAQKPSSRSKPTLSPALPYASVSALQNQTHNLGRCKKKATHNTGNAKMQANETCLSVSCFSIWQQFQLDVINLAKCKSSTFKYKFSFSCRA